MKDNQTYKELREDLIMLQIIALGELDVIAGRTKPLKKAFAEMRRRTKRGLFAAKQRLCDQNT